MPRVQAKLTKRGYVQLPVDPDTGLVCPWCASSPPILTCPHNPFALLRDRERLQNQVDDLRASLANYHVLRDCIQQLVNEKP